MLAIVPRAAVAVAVRWTASPGAKNVAKRPAITARSNTPYYVLVKRAREPNKGIWSLPGGKIEAGEQTLSAAQREINEETGLISAQTFINGEDNLYSYVMQWHPNPFTCTDSIHYHQSDAENNISSGASLSFHYVLSICFAEVMTTIQEENYEVSPILPPELVANDDALDASWWTLEEVVKGVEEGRVSPSCDSVLLRAELMHQNGLLGP